MIQVGATSNEPEDYRYRADYTEDRRTRERRELGRDDSRLQPRGTDLGGVVPGDLDDTDGLVGEGLEEGGRHVCKTTRSDGQ